MRDWPKIQVQQGRAKTDLELFQGSERRRLTKLAKRGARWSGTVKRLDMKKPLYVIDGQELFCRSKPRLSTD
jgi:hypothetical protein